MTKTVLLGLCVWSMCFAIAAKADSKLLSESSYTPAQKAIAIIGGSVNHPKETIVKEVDVKNYIEQTYLNDQAKMGLFSQAGSYSKYLILKEKWLNRKFENGLKELIYLEMISREAKRKNPYKVKVAFTSTSEDLYQAVKSMKDKALGPILEKDGKGIYSAIESFGNLLIEKNYPHKKEDSARAVYDQWISDNKLLIQRKLINRGINQWKNYLAASELSKGSVKSEITFSIMPTYKKIMGKLESLLDGKELTSSDVNRILNENRDLKVLIKSINLINLKKNSVSAIISRYPEQFQSIKNKIINKLEAYTKANGINKIIHLIQKSGDLAKKYDAGDRENTKTKLNFLSDQQSQMFLSTNGNYKNYTLSLLYSLASEMNSKLNLDELSGAVEETVRELIVELNNNDSFKHRDYKNFTLQNFINRKFHNLITRRFHNIDFEKNLMMRKVVDVISWVIEYEVEKFSFQHVSRIDVESYGKNEAKTFRRIKNYLTNEKVNEILTQYHERELREDWKYSLSVYPFAMTPINNLEALDYILNK